MVVDDGTKAEFRCLGFADRLAAAKHGNPRCDPLKPYGDFPTGNYMAIRTVSGHPYKRYGVGPRWALTPWGGDAVRAHKNGRYGLLICGGALLPNKDLRPTRGDLRVDDSTIMILADLAGYSPFSLSVKEEG